MLCVEKEGAGEVGGHALCGLCKRAHSTCIMMYTNMQMFSCVFHLMKKVTTTCSGKGCNTLLLWFNRHLIVV